MSAASAPRVPSTAWLILRRRGGLWGVPHGTLRELTGSSPDRLELADGETLVADEVLAVTGGLEARPFPRCLRPYYPQTVFGMAVWQDRPLILLEPGATPPECLRATTELAEKADEGDEIR